MRSLVTPTHRPPPGARLLALLLVVLLPGCSGDDGGSESATAASDATSDASASEGATTSASSTAPTSAGGETTGDTTAGTGGSDSGASDSGSGGSTSDTGEPAATCQQDGDCQLVDDCCTCDVIGQGDDPPKCDVPECFATTCSAEGLVPASAACRLGQCHLGPLPCAGPVDCAQAPPDCAAGTLPSIVNGCWGACVPARLCDEVPSCDGDPCGPGWFCVETQSGAPARCHPTPETCGGELSCGCLFSFLPEFCPASCAEQGGSTILCEDGG